MASSTTSPRPRGRPPKPILSPDRITDAASRIVTTQGYRHLTMTGLAKELRVSTSALYNHTPSKRDVLIRLQDRINQRIDISGFGALAWDRALERWARSYRDVYASHTPLIPLIAVLPVSDAPHTLGMYEVVASGLVDGGWRTESVVNVIVAVESLVFGAAYDATAPADIFDPGHSAQLAPVFARAVEARAAQETVAADEAFDLALAAMLDGFRKRLSEQTLAD